MLGNISKRQKIAVVVGVMLALLLAALDQTIVATAMPRIVQDLNGLEYLSWVFTAYLLASTVIVPIYGKLSDIYGRKYFILAAVVTFLIGSMLSGLSQSMTQLIVFRAIQGLGAGAVMANAFAIIGDLFPPAERGKWQGMFGGVFGLASVIGPGLGGWLTDNASWRWNFYINVPVGIVTLFVIGLLMPKIKPAVKNRRVDYPGAIFLSSALISLLLALVWGGNQYNWTSVPIFALFSIFALSLIGFLFIEKNDPEPILPLDLFKNQIFTVSVIMIFLTGVGMFGALLYIPLFAQLVLGTSATNSGTILTPMMLGMVSSSIASGQIISRTGKYKALGIFGTAVATLAIFLLSRMTPDTTQGSLIWKMVFTGVGIGTALPLLNVVVQNALDHSKLGIATASVQLFRSIGGTVGTAVLGGILNTSLKNKYGDLSTDPFIRLVSQFNPSFNVSRVDANVLSGLLTGPARKQIDAKLASLPPNIQPQVVPAFNDFLVKTKGAFASSITETFFIASMFMLLAFIASFFLKEIPLRTSHHEAPEEAGVELAEEVGTIPAEDEPEL